MTRKRSKTTSFGTGNRENHDSSVFYNRNLYNMQPIIETPKADLGNPSDPAREGWADRVYLQSAEDMRVIPDGSIGLAFTSPPYNVGKVYDTDMGLGAYLDFIGRVGREVYRVLKPGGRYAVNIANLGRKPYLPMQAYFYEAHARLGFLPMGEIIWQKAHGASGSCAWGSWRSARAPRLRDVHEYILVFAKEQYSRPDRGESDIGRDEFLEATVSIWDIPAESARRVGHPAPFPLALAERVIRLLSYRGDTVLDPFAGSGTTCAAAVRNGRGFVGFETEPAYAALCEQRVAEAHQALKEAP